MGRLVPQPPPLGSKQSDVVFVGPPKRKRLLCKVGFHSWEPYRGGWRCRDCRKHGTGKRAPAPFPYMTHPPYTMQRPQDRNDL